MLSKKEWKYTQIARNITVALSSTSDIEVYTDYWRAQYFAPTVIDNVEYSEIDSLFVVDVVYYRCTLSIDWFDVIMTIIMHCSIIHRVSKRTWMFHIKLRRLYKPTLITYDPASLMYKPWESEETIMYNFPHRGAYVLDGLLSSSSA